MLLRRFNLSYAAACWAFEADFDEVCGDPRRLILLPNPNFPGWAYIEGRFLAQWPETRRIGEAGKTYKGLWIDIFTGQRSTFVLRIYP